MSCGASVYERSVLASYSDGLERSIFEKERNVTMLTQLTNSSISQPTHHCIQSWLSKQASAALWLSMQNPVESSSDSSNTAASMIKSITSVPDLAKPQVLFHFCKLPAYGMSPEGVERHEAGVISLLYSLIVQLVHGLPPHTTSAKDLAETRFGKLDGTMRSWTDAMSLFEDLLSLSMPYLFFAIDEFGLLGYEGGVQPCRDFVLTLRRAMASCGSQQRVLKTLFTTAGRASVLSSMMDRSEIYYETEPARRR